MEPQVLEETTVPRPIEKEKQRKKKKGRVIVVYSPSDPEHKWEIHLQPRSTMPFRNDYDIAMEKNGKYIEESLDLEVENLGEYSVRHCALSDMSAKLISLGSTFFAELLVEAVQSVRKTTDDDDIEYSMEDIKIVKTDGRAGDSCMVKGYLIDVSVAQAGPTRVGPAKIACMDFGLEPPVVVSRGLGGISGIQSDSLYSGLVQIHSEYTLAKKLLAAGANVILSTTTFDNMMQKELMEAHAIGVCVSKKDLEEFSKATGALISTPADMEREGYVFDHSLLTLADEVVLEHAADSRIVLILKGIQPSPMAIVFLRNGVKETLDLMEWAFRGALDIVKMGL